MALSVPLIGHLCHSNGCTDRHFLSPLSREEHSSPLSHNLSTVTLLSPSLPPHWVHLTYRHLTAGSMMQCHHIYFLLLLSLKVFTTDVSCKSSLSRSKSVLINSSRINPSLLKLIINSYVEKLLLQSSLSTDTITSHLNRLGWVCDSPSLMHSHHRLSPLSSDHVANHPALAERKLFVGEKPPNYDPDYVSHCTVRHVYWVCCVVSDDERRPPQQQQHPQATG